jgi:hypothetical protein
MAKQETYLQLLKESIATSEFDTKTREYDVTKVVDTKGPMTGPILSYNGDGELVTNQDAASILERYYFKENQEEKISISEQEENEVPIVPETIIEKLIKEMEDETKDELTEPEDEDEESKKKKQDELNIDKEVSEASPPALISARKQHSDEYDLNEAYTMFKKQILEQNGDEENKDEEKETEEEIKEWLQLMEEEEKEPEKKEEVKDDKKEPEKKEEVKDDLESKVEEEIKEWLQLMEDDKSEKLEDKADEMEKDAENLEKKAEMKEKEAENIEKSADLEKEKELTEQNDIGEEDEIEQEIKECLERIK